MFKGVCIWIQVVFIHGENDYFHGKNSLINQDLGDNILDISGHSGIRFNNKMEYSK